jgi:hypothetical protein
MPLRRLLPCLLLLVLSMPARAADTDKFLPDRTQGVVTIHVKQLLESPLLKDYTGAMKKAFKDQNVGQVGLELLGFDPFSDIERIVIAISGNPDNDQPVVLIQGPFENAKMQAAAERAANDAKEGKGAIGREKINGITVYSVKLETDGATAYLGLLDQGIVVASGDRESVLEALEKKAGRRKSEVRKDLQSLLAKADSKHVVSVASLSGPLNFGGLLGNVLGNLRNVTGGVTLGEEIKVDIALTASDPANAKRTAGALEENLNQAKAVVAVLVTQKKELSPLADLVNGVKVAAKDSDVAFRLTINKELLDSMFKKE